jgi:hypothetical protein
MKVNLLLLFVPAFTVSCNIKSDEEQIREVYENYKAEIIDGYPEIAVNYVHEKTFNYYQRLLDASISDDSTEISKLSDYGQITVEIIRETIPMDSLILFDGKRLFQHMITGEAVDKKSVAATELGTIILYGDSALAYLMENGIESPYGMTCYKVQNVWKIDIASLFQSMSDLLGEITAEAQFPDEKSGGQNHETQTETKSGEINSNYLSTLADQVILFKTTHPNGFHYTTHSVKCDPLMPGCKCYQFEFQSYTDGKPDIVGKPAVHEFMWLKSQRTILNNPNFDHFSDPSEVITSFSIFSRVDLIENSKIIGTPLGEVVRLINEFGPATNGIIDGQLDEWHVQLRVQADTVSAVTFERDNELQHE